MNIRQLRFFLQIAEVGSVTRAASFLHIAQPALSRQIRTLEEELGVTLFQRSEKGVALTDAGMLLRDRAVALLRHFERVRHEVRDGFNDPSGELVIAMPPSMFDLVTLPVVTRYKAAHPNVLLRVIEGVSGVLNAWSMVQLGKADIAIVTSIEPLATLETSAFLQEPLCLIGPADAKLDPGTPVDLEEVARHQLVVTSRPNTLRLILETAMAERKLPLNVVLETNTPHMTLAAVRAGMGYAALPFCSGYKLLGEGLVSIAPIQDLHVVWTLIQAREQPLSTAGERMKAMLREVAYEQIAAKHWQLARISH
ncbi:MAG: LysR substrate-binding domain-containing protein [Pseudomonadota bacterium]